MTDILFIHGFNGSPTGGSYNLLKERLDPEKYCLHTIDYDPTDPAAGIRDIRSYCTDNGIGIVIGTSLGGFFALCITSLPRIVHNVCWSPSTELLRLGLPEQYARIYKELEEKFLAPAASGSTCAGLAGDDGHLKEHPVRAVFSTEDELLGDRYRKVFESRFSRPELVSGAHRMNEAAADAIVGNVISLSGFLPTDRV